MNIIKIIKRTALITTFGLVSLNAFAASDLPGTDSLSPLPDIDSLMPVVDQFFSDLTDQVRDSYAGVPDITEQMRCITEANYQATYYNMDPDDLSVLLDACDSDGSELEAD